MCFNLFIATDVPIQTGPYIDGRVNLEDLSPGFQILSQHFTLPHFYGVGSTMGCGCGFRYGYFKDEEIVSPEELGLLPDAKDGLLIRVGNSIYEHFHDGEGQEDHDQLADIIEELLKDRKKIELYGVWEGDWHLPNDGRREITVSQIRHKHFFFQDGQVVVLY